MSYNHPVEELAHALSLAAAMTDKMSAAFEGLDESETTRIHHKMTYELSACELATIEDLNRQGGVISLLYGQDSPTALHVQLKTQDFKLQCLSQILPREKILKLCDIGDFKHEHVSMLHELNLPALAQLVMDALAAPGNASPSLENDGKKRPALRLIVCNY